MLRGVGSFFRMAAFAAVGLLALGAAAYGLRTAYVSWATRTVDVCVVTDVSFRIENPEWQSRVSRLLTEVNLAFAPAGVQWKVGAWGGDAYPEETGGVLEVRRRAMERVASCKSDVILGFSAAPDALVHVASAPFSHSLLVASEGAESDAVMASRLTRALAVLFGAPIDTEALVDTTSPSGDALDAASLRLISSLRAFEFSRGVDALTGSWERRVMGALSSIRASAEGASVEAEAHRVIARGFAGGMRFGDAARHLRLATASSPRDIPLRLELARALRRDGQPDAAIAELKHAATVDPSDARPHEALAILYREQLRNYAAADEYRSATELDPTRPEYLTGLAHVLLQIGSMSEAEELVNKAARLDSSDLRVVRGRTWLPVLKEQTEERVSRARDDVRSNPDSAEARLLLGSLLFGAGDHRKAAEEVGRALAIAPANGNAHLLLARIRFELGEYQSAQTELDAAQRSGSAVPHDLASAVSKHMRPSTGNQ